MWIKAFEIVKTKNLRIVFCLGGFHSLMSFVGSVGFSMEGSGLEKVFETVYGKNTVTHMFPGKTISRTLRCHFLVDTPLWMKLIKYRLPETTVSTNEKVTEETKDQNISNTTLLPFQEPLLQELDELKTLFYTLGKSEIDAFNLEQSAALAKLRERVETQGYLISESGTTKLWVQYMNYIDIIKMFIRAERTGNWDEDLAATAKMLNLYAARSTFFSYWLVSSNFRSLPVVLGRYK